MIWGQQLEFDSIAAIDQGHFITQITENFPRIRPSLRGASQTRRGNPSWVCTREMAGPEHIAMDCFAMLAMTLIIWLSTWHKENGPKFRRPRAGPWPLRRGYQRPQSARSWGCSPFKAESVYVGADETPTALELRAVFVNRMGFLFF